MYPHEAPDLVVGDRPVAVGHSERSEDAVLHERGVRPAADAADDLAEQLVVEVVVEHLGARRIAQRPLVGHPQEAVDHRMQRGIPHGDFGRSGDYGDSAANSSVPICSPSMPDVWVSKWWTYTPSLSPPANSGMYSRTGRVSPTRPSSTAS